MKSSSSSRSSSTTTSCSTSEEATSSSDDEASKGGEPPTPATARLANSSNNNKRGASFSVQNSASTPNLALLPSRVKFEEAFESFVQANAASSIVACFESMCAAHSLNIDRARLFEHGLFLSDVYASASANSMTPLSSRHSGGSQHFRAKQRQHASTLASQPPTRLVYQIIKAKTNYWKANELWRSYDRRANHKDYSLSSSSSSSASFNRNLHVLIVGCGPVGLRLAIECAFLGVKCTIVEKRDRYLVLLV